MLGIFYQFKAPILVILDVSAAFYTIDHEIMLSCLKNGTYVPWYIAPHLGNSLLLVMSATDCLNMFKKQPKTLPSKVALSL